MEHYFESREAASGAAADYITRALNERLDAGDDASLVVTGGSSPKNCYSKLAATDLNWHQVHVVLSDERWVPPSHTDSNERLIRETLLTDRATTAQLHPYFVESGDVAGRSVTFTDELGELPSPFAATLLGMGSDGHIASLFVDAENYAAGIDAESFDLCIPIETAASPHSRISLTLNALLKSDAVVLLFFGEAKRATYEQAKLDAQAFPVSKLLHQSHVPVVVFWAP